MAPFGGYDMPLWYSSAKDEHLTVLTQAGLFDTSHMAVVLVRGSQARSVLQDCFSRDLEACLGRQRGPLTSGRCLYGVFLDERGHVLDDAVINQLAEDRYMIVVNAGMGPAIAEHLRSYQGDAQAEVRDMTDTFGKIDLQGPRSAEILQMVLKDPQAVFDKLPYFSFKGGLPGEPPAGPAVELADGTRVLLSRSGYTGELGFEIFTASDQAVLVWTRLLQAGEPLGLIPCGLAARDSLRAGAVLPLSHQDIGDWPFLNNPWTFALPYQPDGQGFSKEFVGRQALESVTQPDWTLPFVGRDPRKITVDESARVIWQDREIGTVLTCVTDMGIGWHQGRIMSLNSPDRPEGFKPRGLCCGFIKVQEGLAPGTEVQLQDARRSISVLIADDVRPDRTARRSLKSMLA
jgi:aminomethyltransferase